MRRLSKLESDFGWHRFRFSPSLMHIKEDSKFSSDSRVIVQAFYREKSVNLTLIAKEGFLTVFGPGTCPL